MGGGEGEARKGGDQDNIEVKEICKAERFNILMAATDKKLKLEKKKAKLEEKKVEVAAASEDSKMLTLKWRSWMMMQG